MNFYNFIIFIIVDNMCNVYHTWDEGLVMMGMGDDLDIPTSSSNTPLPFNYNAFLEWQIFFIHLFVHVLYMNWKRKSGHNSIKRVLEFSRKNDCNMGRMETFPIHYISISKWQSPSVLQSQVCLLMVHRRLVMGKRIQQNKRKMHLIKMH